ncbi:hypothetical protein [Spirosoma endophyticum]|uniref:Uncharacterized protein n=1 Tax=Spirosoma endophyticum TaxID=662367 RepID=A0A1I2FCD0_9BACT|nr:hypothetical protein [Spirosoma endophyticum]SFF02427.1 hypothetical protein SAMN05216167_12524 [Spirosoma endophyticum]
MATTLPPQRKKQPTEAEIEAVINKGSSTLKKDDQPIDDDTVKFFNLRLTQGVLTKIEGLRAKRPRKLASPKLGISTHDWILEAIEEKMAREKRKYSM